MSALPVGTADIAPLESIVGLSEEHIQQLQELTHELTLTDEKLIQVSNAIEEAMQLGLEKYNQTLSMIPSYITGRPTGQEVGSYLSMDLGGTNLRVSLVHLLCEGQLKLRQHKFTVPEDRRTGLGEGLFEYLARCVQLFVEEMIADGELPELPHGQSYSLGFTFSFPVHQTALNRGSLIRWTKAFNMPDVIGKDVVQLLQSALDRIPVNVRVTALVNDTVGCLLANAYSDPNTQVGVIMGTGTNAAYYERISKITKWTVGSDSDALLADKNAEMIINTEWGAFDNERRVLPRTRFDARVDRMSPHPFAQLFEKMSAGMYLGEVLRLVLLDLIDRRLLFDGLSSDELNRPMALETAYMSAIEADTTEDLDEVKRILEEVLGVTKGASTLMERQIVQRICKQIGTRSARLNAAGIGAILRQRKDLLEDEERKISIGIDGSLFEKYPHYPKRLQAALCTLLGEKRVKSRITFKLVKDGSGVGAALAAMLAATQVSP
jgi:hexokinase